MHNLISRSLRFSPDAPAGGAAVATPPAGGAPAGDTIGGVPVDKGMQPQKPAALNLDSEVTYGGKTYKLSDLVGAHERAAKAESTLAEADAAIKSLYGKGPEIDTPEAFEEAAKHLRWARKRGGYTDEEINQEVEQLKQKAGFSGDAGDDEDTDKIAEHPIVKQNQKLQESILRRHADSIVKAAITTTPELKALVDFATEKNGAEDGQAIAKQIEEEMRRHLTPIVRERMQRAGGSIEDIGWIDEAMPAAAKKVIERFKPFVRMVESLGKGSSGPDFLAGQPEKPVERPDVNSGPRHLVEMQLEKWITDRALRGARNAVAGTPG